MIAKCETLKAVHGEPMWQIHAETLTIDNFLRDVFVLWLRFILLLRTFGENELMTALVDNTGAH